MPQWMNVTNFLTVAQTIVLILGGVLALSNVSSDMKIAIAVLKQEFSDLKDVVSHEEASRDSEISDLRAQVRELVNKLDQIQK